MPTFPQSPLAFRTAGFPSTAARLAFKAVPSRATVTPSVLELMALPIIWITADDMRNLKPLEPSVVPAALERIAGTAALTDQRG